MAQKSDLNSKVCRNIRAIARMNDFPIGLLEKEIGKNPGFFSRKCIVTPDIMDHVCNEFGVSVDELFRGDFERECEIQEGLDRLEEALNRLLAVMSRDALLKAVKQYVTDKYGGQA